MKKLLPENRRILHLAQDEKFIDMALLAFERICPGQNDVFILADKPLQLVKQPPLRIFTVSEIGDADFLHSINAYSMVIVHSLNPNFVKIINSVKSPAAIFWIGWGYDYYDLVYKNESDLLLPVTRQYSEQASPKKSLLQRVSAAMVKMNFRRKKIRAIRQVSCFSTEVPSEYQRVKNAVAGKPFPQYMAWNYGTLEDDLTGVFKDALCTGTNILIGNSAALTNNHLDMIDLLKNRATGSRKIIAPLSYGDMHYAQIVKHYGEAALGEHFQPLMDFLPIGQYVDIVQSCGFVVMGHLRQQAFGNLVIMLYMGAKVFLHEKNPYYAFYQSQGVVLYTMQALENDPGQLNVPLDDAQKRGNRLVMERLWSRSAVDARTTAIIQALETAGKKRA